MNKIILCLAVLLCAQASNGIFHGLLFRPFIRLALVGKNPTDDQISAIQDQLLRQSIPVFPGTIRFKLLTWYYYNQLYGPLATTTTAATTTQQATTAAATTSQATTTTTTQSISTTTSSEATSTTAALTTTTEISSTTT